MADDRAELGRRGERLARRFLRKQLGYVIVTENYRTPVGEIDLIALDGPCVVFVEVKTRRSEDAGDVEEAVGPIKQRRLARAARHFLATQPDAADRPCRFDVLAIVCPATGKPHVRHVPDAFTPE